MLPVVAIWIYELADEYETMQEYFHSVSALIHFYKH